MTLPGCLRWASGPVCLGLCLTLALDRPPARGAAPRSGEVAGEVVYQGPPVSARGVRVTRDSRVCGPAQPAGDLVVADGRLVHAVITLEARGTKPGPATGRAAGSGEGGAPTLPVLDQKGCRFAPRVLVVPPGSRIRVLNPDGVLHTVEVSGAGARLDLAMEPGRRESVISLAGKFDRPEVLAVRCSAHPWMAAWIVITESPHAAVTDGAGRFRLPAVAPGRYALSVWHERFGVRVSEIEVRSGEVTRPSFRVGDAESR